MQRSNSSATDICAQATKGLKQEEKIFSLGLISPIVLLCAFLALLRFMTVELETHMDEAEPFKEVWWSGPIFFTVVYLAMVFVGPKLMKNREEFKIKPYIFTYNLYQCVLNIWTVVMMVREVYENPIFPYAWGNVFVHGRASYRISFLVWVHYNNKFVELLDTVWMVLRKKDEQVSFLHCYHHILLIWSWFTVCKIELGGDSYFGSCVNSFIHIIMYGYYTLALLGVPCPWKKWITNCQMAQFCLVFGHSCYVLYMGNTPIVLALAQAFVMLNMLVLFGMFYVKKYSKHKGDKKL
jgi:elongation of very long chain fatty acids protein 4